MATFLSPCFWKKKSEVAISHHGMFPALSLSVCVLAVAAGQSASRGGAAVAHHLRGQVRPSEGRQRELCEGQRSAGADGHGPAEQQRGASAGDDVQRYRTLHSTDATRLTFVYYCELEQYIVWEKLFDMRTLHKYGLS